MEYIVETYRFGVLWNPSLLILAIIVAGIYLWAIARFKFPISKGKKVSFVFGVIIFYIAAGSPLHLLGHKYLFSAHMFEQAIIYFVAIPLIVLGLPDKLFEIVMKNSYINKGVRIFTNPIVAALLFNGLFSIYHVPMIFDFLNQHHLYHDLFHYLLTFSSFMMWLSIIQSPHKSNELSELKKLGYIIVNSVLITPVCALIIFSNKILYTTYLEAPQLFQLLPRLEDQQLGGIVMKIIQEGVFIFVIAIIFFKWVKKERDKDDAKSLSDIPSSDIPVA